MYLSTVKGRKNETDRVVLQIIWDIPIFCPPITEHYESGRQVESLIGLFQIIYKTSQAVSFFLPIPVVCLRAHLFVWNDLLIGRCNILWFQVFSRPALLFALLPGLSTNNTKMDKQTDNPTSRQNYHIVYSVWTSLCWINQQLGCFKKCNWTNMYMFILVKLLVFFLLKC